MKFWSTMMSNDEEDKRVPTKLDVLLGGEGEGGLLGGSGVVMVVPGDQHISAVTVVGVLFSKGVGPHGRLGE